MMYTLLLAGLIFPVISWLSFLGSNLQYQLSGKSSSGIYIPFIGPVLISIWILFKDYPVWVIIVPWVVDIGTILFLFALPGLVNELWITSRFTQIFLLIGSKGNQTAEISFHNGGHYVLKKNWNRKDSESGIMSLGEPGTFETKEDALILTSHVGVKRILHKINSEYRVEDNESDETYSIDDWQFKQNSNKKGTGGKIPTHSSNSP